MKTRKISLYAALIMLIAFSALTAAIWAQNQEKKESPKKMEKKEGKEEKEGKKEGKEEKEESDEKPVKPEELPAAVKAAAEKAAPGAKIISAEVEGEDGKKEYEVKVKSAEGKTIEMDIDESGKIIETEEENEEIITEQQLPPNVAKVLADIVPGGKIGEIEKETVVIYEVNKKVGEKTYEIKITEKGKILSVEAEDEDDDDDEEDED